MSLTLNIRLLGGFSLTYDDRPVAGIASKRSQALLAYLVLHCQTAQPRQRIAFHLWSDAVSDEQSRTNLRKELSYLRRTLPDADTWIGVETKTLQWLPNGNVTVDMVEFESAFKAAEQATDRSTRRTYLEQAIPLYRGDLLPDWEEDWILPEREKLRQMQGRALENLTDLLEDQKNYSAALVYAQQWLRLDSLNEAAYCRVMRLHGLMGDRARALQTYHQCMTVLREELGIDPSATTRSLYEQLLQEQNIPALQTVNDAPKTSYPESAVPFKTLPQSRPALTPLIGREPEWAAICQWAGALFPTTNPTATESPSTVLMLVGEPGIGKTRLLEELRATAQGEAAQVLWGTGFQAEMMRPYGLWIDVLRSLPIATTDAIPAELGFLLPELGQPTQRLPDPSHLFDAVVRSLITWANQSPLVLILDDIQWLDEASAALLHYAIRVLRSYPVWLACSARRGELAGNAAISGVLRALRREQRLQTLEVLPLDREQTADLMRHTATTVPELSLALVNQVFIDSGGNPLFALEIARSLRGQHPPTSASTLETLIRDRLQQLDEPAKEVLPWAAALGRSFQPTIVAEVAEYPLLQLLTAIEHLEQQAIIRPSASLSPNMGYDFAHDIVRQVVYQQLSEPRRQLIHRQIAHKLQHQAGQNDTIASQIAHHASLGGDYTLALTAAAEAAERCLKLFAYAEALELAHQGLQQCQYLDSHARLSGQARLLRVCVMAGVTSDNALPLEAELQQLVQSAQSLGYPDVEAIALETLLILQFERSNFSEVHHHSTRAVEVSRMASSPATAARMLAHSGTCLAEIGRDMIRAEALLLEAQTLATKAGLKNCDVFSGLGCIHLHHGRYDEARSNLRQAWQLAKAQQCHWREFNYLSYLIMTELEAGEPMTALSYCQELSAVAAQMQGEGSEAETAQALTALARYQMAEPDAAANLETSIAALQQVDAKRKLAYVLTRAAVVDLQQARLEQAINWAKFALKNAQIVNHPSEIALSWAILLQGLLASGNQQQAIAEFTALSPILNSHDLSLQARQAIDQILPALQPHSQSKL